MSRDLIRRFRIILQLSPLSYRISRRRQEHQQSQRLFLAREN
jgi:hypothetical protein